MLVARERGPTAVPPSRESEPHHPIKVPAHHAEEFDRLPPLGLGIAWEGRWLSARR